MPTKDPNKRHEYYEKCKLRPDFVKNRKEYAKKYYLEKSQDPEWVEREHKRQKRIRLKVHRKYYYGMSEKDFLAIWTKQEGKCMLCGTNLLNTNNTCVDHDHNTKLVRGLLHKRCNTAIGYIEQYIDKIDIIKEYLKIRHDNILTFRSRI